MRWRRDGRVDAAGGEDLKRDYRYLRMLEHRLQMIEDQQTHTVPDSERGRGAYRLLHGL